MNEHTPNIETFEQVTSFAVSGACLDSLMNTAAVKVEITQTGDSFGCGTEESLLSAMIRLGKRGIPVGCINGGCGVCKIRILEGEVRPLGPTSAAHVSHEEFSQGYRLACRCAPLADMRIEVCRKLYKPFSLKKHCPDQPGNT